LATLAAFTCAAVTVFALLPKAINLKKTDDRFPCRRFLCLVYACEAILVSEIMNNKMRAFLVRYYFL